jgi:hypothetical protein
VECAVKGCTGRVTGRGWCAKHYWRFRTYGDLNHEREVAPIADRFWSKVDKTGNCWLWVAGRRGDGYGAFQVERKRQMSAHRYSYEVHNGPIPAGMVVMHSCDQPLCVNPEHLSLGTNAENCADAARKGRRLPGSKNHQAKLNETQVIEMRERYARGGLTQRDLAQEYGVSMALVSFILTRRAWRHI